jgi:hypothetical protein
LTIAVTVHIAQVFQTARRLSEEGHKIMKKGSRFFVEGFQDRLAAFEGV